MTRLTLESWRTRDGFVCSAGVLMPSSWPHQGRNWVKFFRLILGATIHHAVFQKKLVKSRLLTLKNIGSATECNMNNITYLCKHHDEGSKVLLSFRPLGNLHYLRVWHDNSGKGHNASWYLKYIVIHDVQTGKKYYFLCNRWLAVEHEDGMVRLILVRSPEGAVVNLATRRRYWQSLSACSDHLMQ